MYKLAQNFISDYKYQLKHNPSYWTNNKRKLHGYPLKRKPSNRLSKKSWYKIKYDQLLFSIIEDTIDQTLTCKYQKDFFGSFIEFNLKGDKI